MHNCTYICMCDSQWIDTKLGINWVQFLNRHGHRVRNTPRGNTICRYRLGHFEGTTSLPHLLLILSQPQPTQLKIYYDQMASHSLFCSSISCLTLCSHLVEQLLLVCYWGLFPPSAMNPSCNNYHWLPFTNFSISTIYMTIDINLIREYIYTVMQHHPLPIYHYMWSICNLSMIYLTSIEDYPWHTKYMHCYHPWPIYVCFIPMRTIYIQPWSMTKQHVMNSSINFTCLAGRKKYILKVYWLTMKQISSDGPFDVFVPYGSMVG